jgi:acetyltransferase-like isoleucine patch superfamily enzyme
MSFENQKQKWSDKKYNNIFADKTIVSENCEVMNSKMNYYSRIKSLCHLRDSNLGDYSIVSNSTYINASDIGKFNSIGYGNYIGLWEHNLLVTTHSFYLYEGSGGFVKGYKSYEKDKIRTKIGNDVWTGANVVILKGVNIGDGAVVGASSVVTKDIPPYAIVVGNPAIVLRYRFTDEEIKFLLKIKWWNYKRKLIQEMVDKKVWNSIETLKDFIRNKNI